MLTKPNTYLARPDEFELCWIVGIWLSRHVVCLMFACYIAIDECLIINYLNKHFLHISRIVLYKCLYCRGMNTVDQR